MISLLREQDGVTAVEFGLVFMPLIMLLMAIVKVGEVVWIQNVLNYSVEEAARCGAVNPTVCPTTDQIQSYASGASAPLAGITYTATTPPCGSDVTASYPLGVSAPFLSFSITLSAHACYPKL